MWLGQAEKAEPARLSPEVRAVLAAAQAVIDPRRGPAFAAAVAVCPSAEHLAHVAVEHHMLGHVERLVRTQAQGAVPQEFAQRLAVLQLHTGASGLLQAGRLLDFVDLLAEQGITAMPVKGPVWSQYLYGDATLRSWGDLDLIVPLRQVEAARDVLLAAGLEDDNRFNPRLIHRGRRAEGAIHLTSVDKSLHVDLHWQFGVGMGAEVLTAERLLEHSVSYDLLGRSVRGPCAEDLLLTTCLHGSRHRWDTVDSLLALGVQVGGIPEDRWESVVAVALAGGQLRRMVVGVAHACHVLGIPVPSAVAGAFLADPGMRGLLASLGPDTLEPAHFGGVGYDAERLLWFAATEDTAWDAFRHLMTKALLPGPEDWDLARPQEPMWQVYLFRPPRLVYKWARRAWRDARVEALS